jgi:hypothetical protein
MESAQHRVARRRAILPGHFFPVPLVARDQEKPNDTFWLCHRPNDDDNQANFTLHITLKASSLDLIQPMAP